MIPLRTELNALRAIYLTLHLSLKFPTPVGVVEVQGDPEMARACYIATLKDKEKLIAQTLSLDLLEPLEFENKLKIEDGIEEIPLMENVPYQVIKIGSSLFE